MVYKAKELELATYYRERGFSYSEIAKLCKVSKGTVSNWFANKKFSKAVKKDNQTKAVRENIKRLGLINKARETERTHRYKEAIKSAELEYKHYKNDPLFIAGVMLYVSGGDNQDKTKIRFANSSADLHCILHNFLKNYLGVEQSRLKFWLLLYPDLDETTCKRYWQKRMKLSPAQFYKTQVVPGRSLKRTLQYGVGNTIISDTLAKYKLNRWIELAQKELSKKK